LSLLERFAGDTRDRLVAALRFLADHNRIRAGSMTV